MNKPFRHLYPRTGRNEYVRVQSAQGVVYRIKFKRTAAYRQPRPLVQE